MPAKASPASPPTHPSLGTRIDNGNLELQEVLGVGGYGVVYGACDTKSCSPRSYAVKCLIQNNVQSSTRQRQLHMREIFIHQLACKHPNIVTLHRVVEEGPHTFIIMEYAPDGDLFTQILNHRRYLANDNFIRHVFLQILDAVEYCHVLGIYHRDLKPENVLCFDGGLRVAITDFGLATTEKVSNEFRTGSVYHMSPECQGDDFNITGSYSPMANDIWSLAIILLNLATGRNPWKSASRTDPTFQAYLQDPYNFLPTVLPISPEVNRILVRMLALDWRDRVCLAEVRQAIEEVETFYSADVIFDGSMARCAWEAGMDIDGASCPTQEEEVVDDEEDDYEEDAQDMCEEEVQIPGMLQSRWSDDSCSALVFKKSSFGSSVGSHLDLNSSNAYYRSSEEDWSIDADPPSPTSPTFTHVDRDYHTASPDSGAYDHPLSPPDSAFSSFPTTPRSVDLTLGNRTAPPTSKKLPLYIDTDCLPRYYGAEGDEDSIPSCLMHTACEAPDDGDTFYSPIDSHINRLGLSSPVEFARGSVYEEDDSDDLMDHSIGWRSSKPSPQSTTTSDAATLVTSVVSPCTPQVVGWSPVSPDTFHGSYHVDSSFQRPLPPLPSQHTHGSLRHPLHPHSEPSDPLSSGSFFAPSRTVFKPMSPPHCPSSAHDPQLVNKRAALLLSPRHWFSPAKLFHTGAS